MHAPVSHPNLSSPLLNQCQQQLRLYTTQVTIDESAITILATDFYTNLNASLLITIDTRRSRLVIYSQNPDIRPTSEPAKQKLIPFLARVNELLLFGNLEMNYDSGEIRFKTSQMYLEDGDATGLIRFMLEQHSLVFPHICAGVNELLTTDQDPLTIVDRLLPRS